MRISDWSSDVCSSDLGQPLLVHPHACRHLHGHRHVSPGVQPDDDRHPPAGGRAESRRGGREPRRMSLRTYALGGGFGCLALAAFVQGVLPMLEPQSRHSKVTSVVRTDLGELKWMEAQATDYTELQAHGRAVYTREGCWYCHSQFVRPVTGETRRWGPVAQSGEYAFDTPHLFSTRRIGPDLSRVGLKYSDEWHLAHFWDPRMVVPDSIMPRFAKLFDQVEEPVRIVDDNQGNRTLERTPATETLFDFESQDRLALTPNAEGLLFVAERGKYPVILTPNDEYTGETVQLVASTRDLDGLIAYLQKLGMNRGKWRDLFPPQRMEASQVSIPRSEEWIAYGKEVYERRCTGCHGVTGNGNGPAATFMHEFRPRDFTLENTSELQSLMRISYAVFCLKKKKTQKQ